MKTEQPESLRREYRATMPPEVLHLWAADALACIASLEAQLEAVGAGGVGPLIACAGFSAADMATAAAQGFRDGATAQAQPVAELSYEHQRAIMEGERNASLDAYSRVIYLTGAESQLYEAGFTNGWQRAAHGQAPAGATEPTEQQILEAAEKAGLWPNTVHSWIPAFHRYHKELAQAQPSTTPQSDPLQPLVALQEKAGMYADDFAPQADSQPAPATQQAPQQPCPTCAALARTVMLDQVSFDRKPDCYGIRQITDDDGVEEWEDIRTSPDVAREEANDMMATGRGEIYEVVPLWTTPQPTQAQAGAVPLTDEQCDAIYEALDSFGREVDHYEFGLPYCASDGETLAKTEAREVIRQAAHGIKGGQHGTDT